MVVLTASVAVAAVAAGWAIFSRSGSPPSADIGMPALHRETPEIPDPIAADMQPDVRETLHNARRAVMEHPTSADAWGILGKACHAHHLIDCAERCYRRAHELSPDGFRFVYWLAMMLDEHGRGEDEPVALFQSAAELSPLYAPVRFRLGEALARRGRLTEARDAYLRAIELDPTLALAHLHTGRLSLRLGDLPAAMVHLQRAVALAPDAGAVYAAIAQAYLAAGDRAKADEAAEKSRTLKKKGIYIIPDRIADEVYMLAVGPTISFRRAKRLIEAGDYVSAIEELKIVERATPSDPNVHLNLGLSYHATARLEEAAQHLERAAKLSPNLFGAPFELAVVMVKLGRPTEAVNYGRRALEQAPENPNAQLRLAAAMVHNGDYAEAIPLFAQASEKIDLNANGHLKWGFALGRIGAIEEAIDRFRESIRKGPGQPDAYYQLGLTLERQGRITEAIENYQHAADLLPTHPAAQRLVALAQ